MGLHVLQLCVIMEDQSRLTKYANALHTMLQRHSNIRDYILNVFIDIQTSKELIQIDTDKMLTYGTFTMDDEKLTQS